LVHGLVAVVMACAAVGLGCSRKTILFVRVSGTVADPIDELRVDVSQNGRMFTLTYPPREGTTTITLPTSFSVRIPDAEDKLPITVVVTAVGGGLDLASGEDTHPANLGEVVDYTVTLEALAACGDGTIGVGEDCDGTALGTADCASLGFTGGTLACAGDCTYDTTSCTGDPCGNGAIDGTEDCDGAELGGSDCLSVGMGFTSGTLSCATDCTFDTSGCLLPTCGDGDIDPGEDCDGVVLGGADCVTLGLGFVGGTLTCSGACSFDTSACMLATCGDGSIDAGEECDAADLGGLACPDVGMFSGGTLSCTPGCVFDTAACNGAPTVPVLRKPMNNAYLGSIFVAGSRRPTFTWETSTVAGGVTIDYELQYSTDSTFATGVTTASTTALTHMPTTDLPASMTAPVGDRYFWRVRACAGSACSAYTLFWRINVGRSDRDFNGDGYADVVAGAPFYDAGGVATNNRGGAFVYFGGAGPTVNSTADGTLLGEAPADQLGYSVAAAGDVNADGFGDVIVGAPFNDAAAGTAGRAYVYFGGSGLAFDSTPDLVLSGSGAMAAFGTAVAGAGDTNGDGYADVIVGAPGAGISGSAYLYMGGPGAIDTTADGLFLGAAMDDDLGAAVGGAGDVNGDGYADVIAGAPFNDAGALNAGALYLFLGNSGVSIDSTADATFVGAAASDALGRSIASNADVNGDGFADIVAGAELSDIGGANAGQVYIYFGASTPDTVADVILSGVAAGDQFGHAVDAGDVNGDGLSDVIVGAWLAGGGGMGRGVAYVFFGGTPFDLTSDAVINGASDFASLGTSVANAQDVNGDGLADVVVGATGVGSSGQGVAYVYFGGAPFNVVADGTFSGVSPGDNLGASVATVIGSRSTRALSGERLAETRPTGLEERKPVVEVVASCAGSPWA
jgi:hypothetical protein